MDALFEFSDGAVTPDVWAVKALEAINKMKQRPEDMNPDRLQNVSSISLMKVPSNLSFDGGLPPSNSLNNLAALTELTSDLRNIPSPTPPESMILPDSAQPRACALLNALFGFAIEALSLDAIDYHHVDSTPEGPGVHHSLMYNFTVKDSQIASDVLRCRSSLVGSISECAYHSSDVVFYGAAAGHGAALESVSTCSILGVPCFPSSVSTEGKLDEDVNRVHGVLILYSRQHVLPSLQLKSFLGLLASASYYARLLALADESGEVEHSQFVCHSSSPGASVHAWLLLAAARATHADIAEDWLAQGGRCGVALSLERLFTRITDSQNRTVLSTGIGVEHVHGFSSHMCRASLFAGKTIWCNATDSSGILEGVALPMKTAIGVPMPPSRSSCQDLLSASGTDGPESSAHVYVFFSDQRLEQSKSVSSFLTLLQLLLAGWDSLHAAPEVAYSMAPSASNACLGVPSSHAPAETATNVQVHSSNEIASNIARREDHDFNLETSSSEPVDLASCQPNSWDQLSTEQVLTLIDRCLSYDVEAVVDDIVNVEEDTAANVSETPLFHTASNLQSISLPRASPTDAIVKGPLSDSGASSNADAVRIKSHKRGPAASLEALPMKRTGVSGGLESLNL